SPNLATLVTLNIMLCPRMAANPTAVIPPGKADLQSGPSAHDPLRTLFASLICGKTTGMSITINYASTRGEVLRWYGQMWRQRLWKTHLSMFAAFAISASLMLFGGFPGTLAGLIEVVAIGLVPVVGFALFPVLMFKPQPRTLIVGDDGIKTSIGQREGTVAWGEISSIKSDGDALIIQRKNLNSFIVPARAFETKDARMEFCNFVETRVSPKGS
uniref:YcxB family protein n=1 Tax=Altererythrobacter segetis TaxID=1104773 RepID=UPI001A9C6827